MKSVRAGLKKFRVTPWLLLGLVTISVIGYFSVRNHQKFERTVISRTHDQLLTTARSISASIQAHAAILSRTLTVISENRILQQRLRQWDPAHPKFDGKFLNDLVQAHEKDADVFFILDRRGRIVYRSDPAQASDSVGDNLGKRQDVALALSLQAPTISQPFRSATGDLVFTTSQPIFALAEGGEFLGIARWLIKIDTMAGLFVSNVRIGESGYAQIIDGFGNLLAAPDAAQLGRSFLEKSRMAFHGRSFPDIEKVLAEMRSAREGTAIADLPSFGKTGKARVSRALIAYAPIPFGDQVWSVFLTLDYAEVAGPIRASALENLLFAVCVIGIVLVAGRRHFQLRHELTLMQARQEWEDTFDLITDSITIHDENFTIVAANKAAKELLSLQDGGPHKCHECFHGSAHPPAECPVCKGAGSGKETMAELFEPHLNRHIEVRAIARVSETGERKGAIHIVRDISDRKLLEDELKHRAMYDYLTRLPNRMLFLDRLKNLFAHRRRQPHLLFAVLFIDLDHFKRINDTAGHAAGDELLIAVADRMRRNVRPGDTVSRFGGDEFLIIVDDLRSQEDAITAAKRVGSAFDELFVIGGSEVYATASIGIALVGAEVRSPDDLIRNADLAMYHAKSQGRASFALFDPSMHSQVMASVKLENELRRAIKRREFVNHYQPVVDTDTGTVLGFEALTRWMHPEEGLIPPGKFIPMAEENGMISAIGEWAIREACRQIRQWRSDHPERPDLFVSINVSAKQFSPAFPDFVGGVLNDLALPPDALRIEITESLLMEHTVVAHDVLMKLREMDVLVYLDDFGTGYSSLNYLHKFPISALKIDRTFVMNIAHDRQAQEILRAIRMLATSLNLLVIVEGVELQEQLDFFRGIGCSLVQGFLYSPAVVPAEAVAFINNGVPQRSSPV